jgi:hypothetical protein
MLLIAPDSFEYARTLELVSEQAEKRDLECWREQGRSMGYAEALGMLVGENNW